MTNAIVGDFGALMITNRSPASVRFNELIFSRSVLSGSREQMSCGLVAEEYALPTFTNLLLRPTWFPEPKNGAVPHSGARGLIVIRRRPKPPVGRRLNDKMAEESLPPAHSPVVDLVRNLVRKRDFYAGGLIIFFGLVMALKGPGYRLCTLMHMGPGFLPTVLGIILICLGIAIAGT